MDKVMYVQQMQDYIRDHLFDEDFCLEDLYEELGFSRRHADRLFKELLGMTPREYVREMYLTQSAHLLAQTPKNILDIALDSRFQSHEGFTRAFKQRFSVLPADYRKKQIPVPLFTPYPIRDYYRLIENKEEVKMKSEICLCMVTPVERPRRKLILKYAKTANDYLSYCEECGCDWVGLLNSVTEKFDTAAILELPPTLTKAGYSNVAAGIEVPADYNEILPEDYVYAELDPSTMLYFQTAPYENPEDFGFYIEQVFSAANQYNYSAYGYELDYDHAPGYNFGADDSTGAKIAVPVRKQKK